MKIAFQELEAEQPLTQEIEINRRIVLKSIRLHLIKYLSPEGSFKVSLKKDAAEIFSITATLAQMVENSANLNSPYYHGLVAFTLPEAYTLTPGHYELVLEAEGEYEKTASTFLGWVLDWDDVYQASDNPIAGDLQYKYELFSFQNQ